jgi:hypothetical protein
VPDVVSAPDTGMVTCPEWLRQPVLWTDGTSWVLAGRPQSIESQAMAAANPPSCSRRAESSRFPMLALLNTNLSCSPRRRVVSSLRAGGSATAGGASS